MGKVDATSVASPVNVMPPRLYNLAQDPGEGHGLAADHSEKTAELLGVWKLCTAPAVTINLSGFAGSSVPRGVSVTSGTRPRRARE